jgi:alcohol dehydrogenase class IV
MNTLSMTFPDSWSGYSPTQIYFGVNALKQLGAICSNFGDSALLVTGKSATQTGLSDRCRKLLSSDNIRFDVYHGVRSDPTVQQVNEIVERLRSEGISMIIAVGGGSVIDAAKAASVVFEQGGKVEDYLIGNRNIENKSLPVIAIPTTAGTGSELSKGAIISWPGRNIKTGLRGDVLFPKAAIVDPSLTLTLPIEQIRITGFDVFTHAVETYISRQATPITAMYSREAIKTVVTHLPKALNDPQNIVPRVKLSFMSLLMGYNLANSSTCLPHRLQYPLGALTHSPHALGLAALYPSWIYHTRSTCSDRFREISTWMAEGMSLDVANLDILHVLNQFMETIDLKPTLSDLGVSDEMVSQMVGMISGNLKNDPWWQEGADLSPFYNEALINDFMK